MEVVWAISRGDGVVAIVSAVPPAAQTAPGVVGPGSGSVSEESATPQTSKAAQPPAPTPPDIAISYLSSSYSRVGHEERNSPKVSSSLISNEITLYK